MKDINRSSATSARRPSDARYAGSRWASNMTANRASGTPPTTRTRSCEYKTEHACNGHPKWHAAKPSGWHANRIHSKTNSTMAIRKEIIETDRTGSIAASPSTQPMPQINSGHGVASSVVSRSAHEVGQNVRQEIDAATRPRSCSRRRIRRRASIKRTKLPLTSSGISGAVRIRCLAASLASLQASASASQAIASAAFPTSADAAAVHQYALSR